MPIQRRQTGDIKRPRRFYALADAIAEPDPERKRLRMSLQFDAVDAEKFDADGLPFETDDGLAIVRILTTRNRLDKLGVEIPQEGDWISIEISHEPGMPRAWIAPADAGFVPGRALNAPVIRALDAVADNGLLARLQKSCTVEDVQRIKAGDLLRKLRLDLKKQLRITALDVGQASCAAFSINSHDIGYFDVGKPLVFNRHSLSRSFTRSWPSAGFVLLSHWDFDHYAMAINNLFLKDLDWYAPEQPVGPNTAKFQKWLGKRLHFIDGDAEFRGMILQQCNGTKNDRNASGYVFRFERDDEAVLLTGDADYQYIPDRSRLHATSLTIPHHGGRGTTPPKPGLCKRPVAVASYGKPNCYHHPDEKQIALHRGRGWAPRRTAAHPAAGLVTPRSDQLLYPLGQSRAVSTSAGKKAVAAV